MTNAKAGCRQPSFINIGAQKCATTWWYNCACEHPQIFLGEKNVIRYFEQPYYSQRDWKWYLSRFEGAGEGQVIGESRVEYVYNPETPELISKHLPGCKLVLILRDPVDRAVSAYLWNVRRGLLPDLPLAEGLRIAREGDHADRTDEMKELYERIIQMGFYDIQLARYLQRFDPEQMLLLLHDDIKRTPLECMRASFRFLEVDESFVPSGLTRTPLKSAGIRSLTQLERRTKAIHGSSKILDWANRAMGRIGLSKPPPALDDDSRGALSQLYRPHNQRLRKTLEAYRSRPGTLSDHFGSLPDWLTA